MPRFNANRWWTLILTLSLGFAFVASSTTRATAESLLFDELGGTDRGNGTSAPPSPGAGDPDIPITRNKRAQQGSVVRPTTSVSTTRAAGDGSAVDSVMMWHLRAVLQSLGYWGFVRL